IQNGKLVEQCALKDYQQKAEFLSLSLTLTSEAAPYQQVISQLPNLTVKSCKENTMIIELKGTKQEQQQLLKTLIAQDIPVLSLQEHKQRMQDVYLEIANKKD
ncbi:MAG TPA: hypothetical protein PLD88_02800, partial [Candidatus Berkiella sp.]|nr:hypothetical protein [Candidatus Berkiella sp.]